MMDEESFKLKQQLDQSNIETLQRLWSAILKFPCPEESQFALWLSCRHVAVIVYAILQTKMKADAEEKVEGSDFFQDAAVRFASSVMNSRAAYLRNKIRIKKREYRNGNPESANQLQQIH